MIENYLIGQKKNIPILNSIISSFREGNNMNLLIVGPSGYGKTFITALIVNLSYKTKDSILYSGEIERLFVDKYSLHIIDEAHTVKNPERLYQYMDRKDLSFIILTNEYGDLKEPFRNRCLDIHLQEYSEEELGEISNLVFLDKTNKNLNKEQKEVFGEKARGSPRTAKNIAERVLLFTKNKCPEDEKELRNVLGILSIHKGGFREIDRRYLQFLAKVKTASLNTISQSLGIDKGYIKNEIEPFLIKKGIISITSKGRKINDI